MKNLAVFALFVAFVAVVSARPEEGEKYTDQYDKIDVDEILNTERLRKVYYNCLKTGQKCTKEAQTLRDILPDALQNACAKCTDQQKTQARKVIHYIVKNNPEEFLELEKVFDPEHVYRTKYAERIKKEGLVLPEIK